MPLYDYVCSKGCEFEARAGFDDRVIKCSVAGCGAQATRKEVQQIAGVVFTGGGWTRTGA